MRCRAQSPAWWRGPNNDRRLQLIARALPVTSFKRLRFSRGSSPARAMRGKKGRQPLATQAKWAGREPGDRERGLRRDRHRQGHALPRGRSRPVPGAGAVVRRLHAGLGGDGDIPVVLWGGNGVASVQWIPVFQILDRAGFEVMLVPPAGPQSESHRIYLQTRRFREFEPCASVGNRSVEPCGRQRPDVADDRIARKSGFSRTTCGSPEAFPGPCGALAHAEAVLRLVEDGPARPPTRRALLRPAADLTTSRVPERSAVP